MRVLPGQGLWDLALRELTRYIRSLHCSDCQKPVWTVSRNTFSITAD